MTFTLLERNQIYEAIASANLDPKQCRLTMGEDQSKLSGKSGVSEANRQREALISHISHSTFAIARFLVFEDPLSRTRASSYDSLYPRSQGESQKYTYNAFANVIDGRGISYQKLEFSRLLSAIGTWAREVSLVINTPDYWTTAASGQRLISRIQQENSGNTPFTPDEQRQISAQFESVKAHVRNQFPLTAKQMEELYKRLDQAAEATERMSRKDWLVYFLGTATSLIITATVPAGVGEHIFNIVIQGIGHIFTGGSQPPQILP
jgi:hypothetical protein